MQSPYRLPAGLGYSTAMPTMDFETYSEAGYYQTPDGKWKGVTKTEPGLAAVGAPVYSEHPSTIVLSLAYDLCDGCGPQLWRAGDPPPLPLFRHIQAGGLIEAWNSAFEYHIWLNVCHKRMGWPALPYTQLRDAMAKSRAHSLPGKLEKAAQVLGASEQKDDRGKQLIRKLCVPQQPTKTRPAGRCTDPDALAELYAYNIQDIKAEAAVSHLCPDLSPAETALWMLDQAINFRGMYIDRSALADCISIVRQAEEKYTAELRAVTCGAVQTAGEIARITTWLHGRGVHMDNLDAEAVDRALSERVLPPDCKRVLKIRAMLGAASVKKLFAIDRRVSADGRLRDLFAFCGADRTGRWAGRGPQPQNMPGGLPFEDVERALAVISTRNLAAVELCYGDAVAAVSGCLRGLFSAAPGHDLICADFSAIEAVVLAELAGESWRQEVFRTHGKIYEASAATITGIPFEEFMRHKEETGQHHPMRKKVGKVAELASGYQGAVGAWKAFGADEFMTDDEILTNVKAWRKASPMIVKFWYGVQDAAHLAVQYPGHCYSYQAPATKYGQPPAITFGVKDDILYCKLPSGRNLTYHNPRLEPSETYSGKPTLQLTYMGWNSNYLNGPVGWMRLATHGGKLTENCIARGTLVLTSRGYIPIEKVTAQDRVHDGVEFVNHLGLRFTRSQKCVMVDGVFMTPDHEVLTNEGWKTALEKPRPYRPAIRKSMGSKAVRFQRKKNVMGVPLSLRKRGCAKRNRRYQRGAEGRKTKLRLPHKAATIRTENTWAYEASLVRGVAVDDRSMPIAFPPSLGKLRREGYTGLRTLENVRVLLGRRFGGLPTGAYPRSSRQQRGILPCELSMGGLQTSGSKQAQQRVYTYPVGRNNRGGSFRKIWYRNDYIALPHFSRVAQRQVIYRTRRTKQTDVYDILNCGPRHRFVVLGDSGPFIVHNCIQAVSRDILAHSMLALDRAGYPIVLHVHDEIVAEVPQGWGSVKEFEQIMGRMPPWAAGWPVKAAGGWRGLRYRKE